MGLGLHGGGVGAARFFSRLGSRVIITDLKSRQELAPSVAELKRLKYITYHLGGHRLADFRNADYVIKVFRKFEGGELGDLVSMQAGTIDTLGFHTVDLNFPVLVKTGDKFYIYVSLSKGGHPFDRTSNVPVLLGGQGRPTVESRANPGESFYRKGNQWIDLANDDSTANFCIKALSET